MPDLGEITARQQKVWATGNFARIAARATIVGELLCETVDVRPGERVLDVAAGTGNTALAASRRWCEVTASDFVPELLEIAQRRADCEGLPLETRVGDVQHLPFEDTSFDVVLSSFGAIFGPDQQRTADELVRVCRHGGRIGMANWIPDGLVGDMFRVTATHVPPPPGLRPAVEWGTEARLRELFENRIASLAIVPRELVFRSYSAEHMLEWFRTWSGPTMTAFAALDVTGQQELATDLLAVFERYNRSGERTLIAPSAYIEAVAVRA
jgi:ubiquinone/menaquinone biosynthesis C-methylase UbiE